MHYSEPVYFMLPSPTPTPTPPTKKKKKKDKKAAVGQGRRPMVRKFLDERSSENRKPNVTWSWVPPPESSHQRCSIERGVLKNVTNLTGKQLCQSLFFNKVTGLSPATLLEKRLCARVSFLIKLQAYRDSVDESFFTKLILMELALKPVIEDIFSLVLCHFLNF